MFIGLERQSKAVDEKKKPAIIKLYKFCSTSDIKTKTNHEGDLRSYKEEFCGETDLFSDLDYQGNEITGYEDEATFVEKLMELYKTSEEYFQSHEIEYGLRNQNCATWVNGILKAAGITEDELKKKREFKGIDWGEDSDNLKASFQNNNK